MRFSSICFLILLLVACERDARIPIRTLFSDFTEQSGVIFENLLNVTDSLNPYTYRNFYNGAGVALGDINNDGLVDIYFSGNQVANKLFLNKGNFQFTDITKRAGVACDGVWSTGVTFVDINGDGWLDIYVCKSGSPNAKKRHNELFINNGDLTFSERAAEFGLDYMGLGIQAAFFDYDKDGDLDCYLLTNSFKVVGNFDLLPDQRSRPDPQNGGNKFLRNENGKFVDFSAQAGIYRSSIGFGLGITLGDFNDDDWTDIFVSNDFFERDYLYINNQKGGFVERLTENFESISMGSMGADFADLDNDGEKELFVTEMLPDSLPRRKSKTVYENWNKYRLNLRSGYHHQFSRNVLQKKIGRGAFAEVGRFAGVASTEWSWGALLFDMDNDGQKDIFIANGIYKDLLDRDYLAYDGAAENIRKIISTEKDVILKLISRMPTSKYSNYAFKNNGGFHFTNVSQQWGLSEPMYSNGSAYGDLDNDGDLDLVISNLNSKSRVFRNNTDTLEYKSITLKFEGIGQNKLSVGADAKLYHQGRQWAIDNFPSRGYQSCVPATVVVGLGKGLKKIDSLVVTWPTGGATKLFNVSVNRQLIVQQMSNDKEDQIIKKGRDKTMFSFVSSDLFRHQGANLNDFDRDKIAPMGYSNETPSIAKADINRDGVEEIYVGGGKGQAGVFLRYKEGVFKNYPEYNLAKFSASEQTKSIFFDADGDGNPDLYMANGGRFFPKSSDLLADRLFINDGAGVFYEKKNALPFVDFIATSVVRPIDFDRDNDIDLFVGERFDPFSYGRSSGGYLLENDGQGNFFDVTVTNAPVFKQLGMVTDAKSVDVDNDGFEDLVVVGDWEPVRILLNLNGNFVDHTQKYIPNSPFGWWRTLEVSDLNNDGKPDFVLGNFGSNSFFKRNDRLYISDFDRNGSVEQIYCTKEGEKYYPIADKDDLLAQLPSFKKQLLYYKDYATKSIQDILVGVNFNGVKVLEVNYFESAILLSNGSSYELKPLPFEAQLSPVYALLVEDFDQDGIKDLLAGGNQYMVKPQFGRMDASRGWFFKGSLKSGQFNFERGQSLGVPGEIRDIEMVQIKDKKYILIAKHDDEFQILQVAK